MTLARRLATGDTYAVFVASRMRTETRASSASVYVSSVPQLQFLLTFLSGTFLSGEKFPIQYGGSFCNFKKATVG